MAFREKIELVVDVVAGQTRTTLSGLRRELDDTDGAFGKMRVAGSGAFDLIKQNAGALALGAGTAIAAFGAKAVSEFQDVALGAGKLRDALGVTAEQASQLQEVAGDLGVGVGAVETAIGRMNRTVASTPEAFDAIGASIKRNRDGTLDVVGTFESAAAAIDKIPDAGKRAEAAQKIFGRGWQDIAELIRSGADGISDSMAEVESAKVMDDEDIAQARKFRDTMDELKGVLESVTLAIGERIVPVLDDTATAIMTVKNAMEELDDVPGVGDAIEFLTTPLGDALKFGPEKMVELKDRIDDLIGGTDDGIKGATGWAGLFSDGLGELEGVSAEATATTEAQAAALDDLIGFLKGLADAELEARDAVIQRQKAMSEAREEAQRSADGIFDLEEAERALIEATKTLHQRTVENTLVQLDSKRTAEEKATSAYELRDAEIAAATAAFDAAKAYAEEKGAAEGSAQSAQLQRQRLIELANQFPSLRDEIQLYIDKLLAIPTSRTTTLNIAGAGKLPTKGRDFAQAAGGPIRAGDLHLVGEEGPELFVSNTNGTIIPNGGVAGVGSPVGVGAGTTNIVVNMPPGADGRDIVRQLRRYSRYNGSAWMTS